MARRILRRFGTRAIAFGLAGILAGCSGSGSPVRPSAVSVAGTTAADLAAGVLTPEDLEARGWTCFEPPVVPPRIICSHPNQGLPVVGNPPPADRPATYNLFRFDATGALIGPVHLIRTDLYHDQTCGSSGEPYVLVPIIGYYECLHPVDR